MEKGFTIDAVVRSLKNLSTHDYDVLTAESIIVVGIVIKLSETMSNQFLK